MISRRQQARSCLYFAGLVFLLIFNLSGCYQGDDTSSPSSPDQQTQDENDNQPPIADNENPDDTSNPDTPPQNDTGNQPPIAKIIAPNGDFTSSQVVTLNGAGSYDPDGDRLIYKWTQTEGPSIELANSSSANLTFVAPSLTQTTQFTFELSVGDGSLSSTDSVTFQIASKTSSNHQPSAIIDAPQISTSGQMVTLDGSGSNDPDGDKLSYHWEQVEGPNIALSTDSAATLIFVAPVVSQPTLFTFQLTVDDGELSNIASASIQIKPNDDSPSVVIDDSWDIKTGKNSADMVENYSFEAISIDLNSMTVTSNSSTLIVGSKSGGVTPITLNGTTVATVTEETYGVTIDSTSPDDTLIEFALHGGYNKTVTFYSDNSFKISLNSIAIDSSDGPAINIQSKQRAFVFLPNGSTNTLTDTTTWSDRTHPDGDEMDLKGTIFSEGPLIFSGTGSLAVTAAKKHALASDGHVRIREGGITLTTYKKDGIRSNDAFILDDGNLTISTTEGKGIKVEGKEDDTVAIGFIAINNGNLEITSYDKAITATWKSDEDGETSTLDDDPDPRVTINGGSIKVKTTGTPYEDRTGDESLAPEGIEAKSLLTINDGTLEIDASDDALNGLGAMEINGGYTYAVSSDNDAIDTNGKMTISGGIIVANGADRMEGGLDCDRNTFKVTGGTFIGTGGRNSAVSTSVTTQNTVSLSNIKSGLLTIEDSSGNIAFAYKMPESVAAVLLSSPDLKTGTTYSIYQNGSLGSYSEEFHDLYLSPASRSGGASSGSFTINSTVTTSR